LRLNDPELVRRQYETEAGLALVGFATLGRPFTAENGAALLSRHFSTIERRDVEAALVFPNRAAIQRYIESSFFRCEINSAAPEVEEPFRARTVQAVFVAGR
jgi:hypothetical protein